MSRGGYYSRRGLLKAVVVTGAGVAFVEFARQHPFAPVLGRDAAVDLNRGTVVGATLDPNDRCWWRVQHRSKPEVYSLQQWTAGRRCPWGTWEGGRGG